MQQEDKKRFSACLMGCAEMYGKEISLQVAQLWFETLKAFDIGAIEQAFGKHLMNPDSGQFMPKPADIVKHIAGTTQDSALIAWGKVEQAMKRVGAYQTIVFDDPIIHLVITDMGGWVQLCRMTLEEMPFRAKEFENRYRAYRNAGAKVYPAKLSGIFDSENVHNGFEEVQPVLIGDATKAQQVLLGGTDKPALPIQIMQAADRKLLN